MDPIEGHAAAFQAFAARGRLIFYAVIHQWPDHIIIFGAEAMARIEKNDHIIRAAGKALEKVVSILLAEAVGVFLNAHAGILGKPFQRRGQIDIVDLTALADVLVVLVNTEDEVKCTLGRQVQRLGKSKEQ